MTADDRQTVAVLLTRARRAAKGAAMAREAGDAKAVKELEAKARRLRDEAEAMDLAKVDPSWDDGEL